MSEKPKLAQIKILPSKLKLAKEKSKNLFPEYKNGNFSGYINLLIDKDND